MDTKRLSISSAGAIAALILPVLCVAQQPAPQLLSPRAASRILDQGTWGPVPGAVPIVQAQGFERWFTEQVLAPQSTYPDQPFLDANGKTNTNLSPVQVLFFQHAVGGPDQLRQRVAFALSEIWVVSNLEVNNASAFPPLLRIFQSGAFNNYENLMRDVTLNPAMGRYLNMANNDKGNPAKGTAPNENYARETMQLFTLGLSQLHSDGTPVLDSRGNPRPTYTQADVTGLAKAFTGWTYPSVAGTATKGHNPTYYLGSMVPIESYHDVTQKQILGVNLPPGQSAEQDLKEALHIIFMHPNLPPFISQQLIQHLVTSNPSPAYVERVAEVFENNGFGVRGDLKAVVHAILGDPEARAGDVAGAPDPENFGHMREPILFIANLLRALSAGVTSTGPANAAANLGQRLFYPPSVFSYFSPQYKTSGGLLGPEFQIYSTQTAATRADSVNSAIYGGQFDAGTKFNISSFVSAGSKSATLIELINQVFFHEDMSGSLRNEIERSLAPLTAPADKARAALYVALTSGEYQIVH